MSEIDTLLTRLASDDAAAAEGALARLAIQGARVIEPLLVAYPLAVPPAQVRMLRLLERVPDGRATRFLAGVVSEGPASHRRLAVRALGALPPDRCAPALWSALAREAEPAVRAEIVALLARMSRNSRPEFLDRVLDILFDAGEPTPVRRAALVALAGLGARPARRLFERLADAPGDPLGAECGAALARAPEDPRRELPRLTAPLGMDSALAAVVDGPPSGLESIPAALARIEGPGARPSREPASRALDALTPAGLRDLAERLDPSWPPSVIDQALDALRETRDGQSLTALVKLARGLARRGRDEPDDELRQVLAGSRSRAHRVLAEAGSRLGIADLKDALRELDPTPPDLVLALSAVGRTEDLTDLLAAHERADGWLRREIEGAAREILRREGPRRARRALAALPGQQRSILQPYLDRTRPGRVLPDPPPSPGGSA